jgi:hypothetical protein
MKFDLSIDLAIRCNAKCRQSASPGPMHLRVPHLRLGIATPDRLD